MLSCVQTTKLPAAYDGVGARKSLLPAPDSFTYVSQTYTPGLGPCLNTLYNVHYKFLRQTWCVM